MRARRRNREQHVEQGLAGGRLPAPSIESSRRLEMAAAVRRDLVGIAAGFEHAMAGHDDHERVAGDRLRDRAHRAAKRADTLATSP